MNCVEIVNTVGCRNYLVACLWRWALISKSYFQLEKFETALEFVAKLEQLGTFIEDKYISKSFKSSVSVALSICKLLSDKNAGNEAYKSGRYAEAVEHYTVALSSNIGSRTFAAFCLNNRAAAHQALDQIMDAIADCSLATATALKGDYVKAVSRRATLHEKIRDYVQAASDLQRIVTIMKDYDKAKESSNKESEVKSKLEQEARRLLPLMKEEAKKRIPLNFNLILGIKASDTSAGIKKAYRIAALKHHPDKSGQFLARTESRIWKEISVEVQKDADRLFKMIEEAYAVLLDPIKRSPYDLEENMRKAAKERRSKERASGFQNSGYRPEFSPSWTRTSPFLNEYWKWYKSYPSYGC